MTRHHEHCLVCGHAGYGVMGKEFAHAYLVQCENCGMVFSSRIPSPEELAAHYSGYPRNTRLSPLTLQRYEELLDQFEAYRKTNRLLDVGCGDGHFLAVAKARNWEVYGTEYTDEAVAVCEAKGIGMHKGIIQDRKGVQEFDVITSFEVLEHITDGREHAATIHELLRNGGLFYFTTPNFNSLSRRYLGGRWKMIEYPEHLSYYTASTITRLLNDAGFKKLQLNTTGISMRRTGNTGTIPAGREEELRTSIEERSSLRVAKHVINWWLSVLRLGDTLKGFFVK
jgi:SAM-dependent methyltransferase